MSNLESLIKKSGLKKAKIAEDLGITPKTLRLKTLSPATFSIKEIILLAELIKIEPSELFEVIVKANKHIS
jgi:transcriptional regulator with XRE-family HTH domain